jgi:hypothetical protein
MFGEIIVAGEGLVAFRTLVLSGFVVDGHNMPFEKRALVE